MPVSEERRGRWKRRRRGGLAARKPKQEEDDVEDEEEDNNNDETDDVDNTEDMQQNGDAASDPGAGDGEALEEVGARVADFPAVVRRGVIRPHASVAAVVAAERAALVGETRADGLLPALENISYGQLQALSALPADSPAFDPERSDGTSSACVISPPPIMEGEGVVKRFGNRVHVVPMHSDWFSPNTVNRLERQVVPHFFSGKSPNHTPEKYMELRNSVVAKYMNNPEKRITISDFQGSVDAVNSEDLTRVVRFLDHWGIINYCSAAQGYHEPSSDISCVREDVNGEVHVPSAALKSIDSLVKFDKPRCRHKAADLYSSLSCPNPEPPDLDSRIREHICENHCNHCSRPLPTVYFQSQKEGDVLLCSDCFHHGRFVIGHSSIDFTRVDPAKDYGDPDGENWSSQETLMLLEAVELYNENWVEIAEHVGSKSKAQCILHFLRLPVEDCLLDNVDIPDVTKSAHSTNGYYHRKTDSNGDSPGLCNQDSFSDDKLPFAKSANPVMALVAFLASAVGPRVAASCAHASLAALSEDDRMDSGGAQEREGSLSHGENQQQNESSSVNRTSCQNGAETIPLSPDKVTTAVRAGLSAAATKAKLFADHEEREIQRLSANIINHQLKRMELKLKQFAEIETLLMKECEQVEKTRQRFAAERARMLSTRLGASGGVTSQSNLPGIPSSMGNNSIMNNNNNNRQQQQQQQQQQQILSASSSSQPSIPGFSNTPQQLHPQMQFMTRQQQPGFSFGPRLPLNAIQTNASSTASPNVMFGNNPTTATSSQPCFSHPMVRSTSGSSSGLN